MKFTKLILRCFAFILAVLVSANLLICAASYTYLGDPFGLFKVIRIMQIMETHYVGDLDRHTLLSGALHGLVDAAGEKHTVFLDGAEYEEFTESTNASYGGIGVYVSQTDQKEAFVAGVIEDSPAEAAGIKRGDLIVAVDGNLTIGRELAEVSEDIRGEIGTSVTLTIKRGDEAQDIAVVRSDITMKTVAGKMVDGTDIGYIRISSFSTGTGDEFAKEYEKLKAQGMERLIVDLRNNPGGLVDQAARVAEYLLPAGSTVVSYTQKNGKNEVFTTSSADDKIPLAVLVNENSASAAEILSGDVQDTHAGVIVGTKTYGKGTVQGVYPVGTDAVVKVTIAKYKTAGGREVDGTGIEPDMVVQLQANSTTDYQLERAIDVVRTMNLNR